jgi:hypothetical protein
MFRLKNSENLARFLYQKTLHNSNSMAYSIGYVDPCSHLSKVYANAFGVSRRIDNRRIEFGRKSCGFYTSCSNNSKFFVRANARPRGFASDLEQGNSVGGDANLIKVDNGGVNGSPAMPRCFRDQRMSEKLVVAVDVDEGMYAIVYEYPCATHFIFYGMSSILYDLIFSYMNNEDLL